MNEYFGYIDYRKKGEQAIYRVKKLKANTGYDVFLHTQKVGRLTQEQLDENFIRVGKQEQYKYPKKRYGQPLRSIERKMGIG